MSTIVRVTPDSPVLVHKTPEGVEPARGSVVMTNGLSGTAWQRFFSDGLWHSVTGQVKPWRHLFANSISGVAVILDVPEDID
jgi:hypothetical protein